MSKCNDFVGMLFLARDVTHSAHLNTRSYAKHVALNEFYDGIIDLADKFAEAYQGKYGLIGPISLMSAKKTNNVVEFLEGQVETLRKCGIRWSKRTAHRFRTSSTRFSGCITPPSTNSNFWHEVSHGTAEPPR